MSGARSGFAALAALCLIWAYTWVTLKIGLADAAPLDFAVLRVLPAAAMLFAVLAVLRRPLRPRNLRRLFWLGLFQTALFNGFANLALLTGGVARTAVLVYTLPLWTLLLAWPLLGERIAGVEWAAAASCGIGLLLVVQPWSLGGTAASKAFAILAGLSWAVSAVLAKAWRRVERYDLLSVTAWQMLLGGLLLLAWARAYPSHPIRWSPQFLLAAGYTSLVGTGLAWFLWLFALERLPAGIASLAVMAVPPLGALFSALQLHERPAPGELAGFLFIGAGVLILSWTAGRRDAGRVPARA